MKPGDYALGSEQSRAAARRLAEKRLVGREMIRLIVDIEKGAEPGCTSWIEGPDGKFGCVFGLPEGMSMEEAEKRIGEQTIR